MHFCHLNFSAKLFCLIFIQRPKVNPVTDEGVQKVLISENKAIVVMTAFSFGLLVADMSRLCNFIQNTLIKHDKSLLYLRRHAADDNPQWKVNFRKSAF